MDSHRAEHRLGNLWLDMAWAMTLLGLHRAGAAIYAVRATRAADHQSSPHALDLGLHLLALAAADAGLVEPAAMLVGYAEAHLAEYEFAQTSRRWFQTRIDEALGDRLAVSAAAAGMHRRELMALIREVEAALAAPST
jgi:hypothetical protein